MSAPTLYRQILQRPWLNRMLQPLAGWYADLAGYRKMGLKADDLIPEESETVQLALKRLSPKETYDRIYRIRRAFQLSLSHHILPPEQFTKAEEDVEYLSPIIREIEAHKKERVDLDNLVLKR